MFIYAIVPDNDTIYLNFAPLTENRFQKRSFCCSKKEFIYRTCIFLLMKSVSPANPLSGHFTRLKSLTLNI